MRERDREREREREKKKRERERDIQRRKLKLMPGDCEPRPSAVSKMYHSVAACHMRSCRFLVASVVSWQIADLHCDAGMGLRDCETFMAERTSSFCESC